METIIEKIQDLEHRKILLIQSKIKNTKIYSVITLLKTDVPSKNNFNTQQYLELSRDIFDTKRKAENKFNTILKGGYNGKGN
jgi:hypothetical protein